MYVIKHFYKNFHANKMCLHVFQSQSVRGLVSMAVSFRRDFTLIPNAKFKRSNRRLAVFTEVLDSTDVSTLGHFRILPIEIFHILLKYLSGDKHTDTKM